VESQLLPTVLPLARLEGARVRIAPEAREEVRGAVLAFLDVAATATGKETYYNTRAEQQAAADAAHDAVLRVNRGLYAALLALPGVTDHNIQQGVLRLLDNPAATDGTSCRGRVLNLGTSFGVSEVDAGGGSRHSSRQVDELLKG
jgi:hypothetical protein